MIYTFENTVEGQLIMIDKYHPDNKGNRLIAYDPRTYNGYHPHLMEAWVRTDKELKKIEEK